MNKMKNAALIILFISTILSCNKSISEQNKEEANRDEAYNYRCDANSIRMVYHEVTICEKGLFGNHRQCFIDAKKAYCEYIGYKAPVSKQ